MGYPVFASGDVLNASDMNAVGLWLVKSQAIGSGVTSVVVSNAFSSDYDNYRIIISGGTVSSNGSVGLQLNAATGTTYQQYGYYGSFGVATINGYGPGLGTSWTDAIHGSTAGYMAVIDICSPNAARPTFATTWSVSDATSYNFALKETSSAQSTGFTLTPIGAGRTFTGGNVRVYGFRN